MLRTGRQLRAARHLVGMDQQQLADASGVGLNTISRMESRDGDIPSRGGTLARVQAALEEAGAVFIPENGGGLGVRLREPGE